MARPRSEDKRMALFEAAIQVFARRGLDAPTAAVSKAAGVAEGTLFAYFPTKDELLNQLYRHVKRELGDAMMSDFPRRKSVKERLHHVWDRFVQWGVRHPAEHQVLMHMERWGGLSDESCQAGMAPFLEIHEMEQEAIQQRVVKDLPAQFAVTVLKALAEATIDSIRRTPHEDASLREAGFEVLWNGLSR